MTTATISPVPRQAAPRRNGLRWLIADVAVMTRRVLARIAREPETLMDVTIQPVIFVLLFAYVFGGAIPLPGGGNYHEYLIGGMLAMGLAMTAPGTAVALVTDMHTGLIDRFRSLPMSRSAVLAGRTIADLVTQVIGAWWSRESGWRSAGGSIPRSPMPPRRSAWPCCSATPSPGSAPVSGWCCGARKPPSSWGSCCSCR